MQLQFKYHKENQNLLKRLEVCITTVNRLMNFLGYGSIIRNLGHKYSKQTQITRDIVLVSFKLNPADWMVQLKCKGNQMCNCCPKRKKKKTI